MTAKKDNKGHLSLEDDINYAQGRNIGWITMREVIHLYLLEKLEAVQS
jgi:hypothetical protein